MFRVKIRSRNNLLGINETFIVPEPFDTRIGAEMFALAAAISYGSVGSLIETEVLKSK